MGNRRIRLLITGLLLVVLMVFIYKTLYPEHRNIAAQSADFNLSSHALIQEMSQTEIAKKYGDKVVRTFGKISVINGNVITLEGGVVATLLETPDFELQKGDSITVKGRCIGYDDLLEEVKLDQASIIKE